jgi:hypothetical protein
MIFEFGALYPVRASAPQIIAVVLMDFRRDPFVGLLHKPTMDMGNQ